MKRSTDRILTTHTGSLPRPADLVAILNGKELGESYDRAAYVERVRRGIFDIVAKQADTGIDIVDDGEHSKVNWMAYARARLSGLEEIDSPVRFRGATRDSLAFPNTYEDMKVMLAGRSGAIVPKRKVRPRAYVCTGPLTYIGQDELQADIDQLKRHQRTVEERALDYLHRVRGPHKKHLGLIHRDVKPGNTSCRPTSTTSRPH